MEGSSRSRTLRFHIAALVAFSLLLAGMVLLAVVTARVASYGPFQWAVVGFLLLGAALSVAWEVRMVRLLARSESATSGDDRR